MDDHEVSVHSALSTARERNAAAAGKQLTDTHSAGFLPNPLLWAYTRPVAEVLGELRDAGVIPGWRNELYPVTDRWHDEPCMLIERAAAVLFGIKASKKLDRVST